METRFMEADVLIIGGGSAGCMAAIRVLSLNPQLKVVIFEKGDIKYSGSIARGMDALNVVAIPNLTTPELFVESNTLACGGILDVPPAYEMARRSFDLLKELESWGVYFPVDKDGNYRTLQMHPKGKFLTAMEEPNLKVMISRMAIEKGTVVVNRTMGVRLLLEDGRVGGAVGIDVRTGDLVVCASKTVILSSGGQARFGLPNSGHLYGTFDFPGNTGDGFVMGFEAGARLTGMEYHQRVTIIKDLSCPLLSICVVRGAKMLDVLDNLLMQWECWDFAKANHAALSGLGPLADPSQPSTGRENPGDRTYPVHHGAPGPGTVFQEPTYRFSQGRHRTLADRSSIVRRPWHVRTGGQRTGGNECSGPLRRGRRIMRGQGVSDRRVCVRANRGRTGCKFCRLLPATQSRSLPSRRREGQNR